VLAYGTALLLAWCALVAYRVFLGDLATRVDAAATGPAQIRMRANEELFVRRFGGEYLCGPNGLSYGRDCSQPTKKSPQMAIRQVPPIVTEGNC
jgi:hypothetical protein